MTVTDVTTFITSYHKNCQILTVEHPYRGSWPQSYVLGACLSIALAMIVSASFITGTTGHGYGSGIRDLTRADGCPDTCSLGPFGGYPTVDRRDD